LVKAVALTQDVKADEVNPFFKSNYATLSAHLAVIKPIFAEQGLAIIQMPIGGSDCVGIKTIIVHEDGGSMESNCFIPAGKDMNGQDAGSVFSYLRRYALAAVAGVATDDDDANTVSQPKPQAAYKAPAVKAQAKPSVPTGDGSPWDVAIHFGKNNGVCLRDLNDKQLDWYVKEYKAEGYNGKPPRDVDIKLREALDAVSALKGNKSKKVQTEEPEDEVPF
jgi:hypothetical protein